MYHLVNYTTAALIHEQRLRDAEGDRMVALATRASRRPDQRARGQVRWVLELLDAGLPWPTARPAA